ncbi:hypothetical protein FGO68_gene10797 [Halteria grandinella]|uniref:Uncharacterized protein n=1 Tax=Halteria grandinella TaxID=5974 RepID=A0A8J8T050_HALGN|nr:hypothetical protein FGO68_gene10797 [Halteria grandinella]
MNPTEPLLQQPSISKLSDKLHYQILVNDPAFLDFIEIHAISLGGSTHQDAQGNKFIFYPVSRNGTDKELAILATEQCEFYEQVGWHDGGMPPVVVGGLYWLTEDDSSWRISTYQKLPKREILEIAITDKSEEDYLQKVKNLEHATESQLTNFTSFQWFIIDRADMTSIDKAMNQICTQLHKANWKSETFVGVRKFFVIFIIAAILMGYLANVLLYFWLVYTSRDYSTIVLILIYIAFLIAVTLQDALALIAVYLMQKKGLFGKKLSEMSMENTVGLMVYFMLIYSIVILLVAIIKMFSYDGNYDLQLTFGIHILAIFAFSIIAGILIYILSIKVQNSTDKSNKLKNYLQHKLAH